jgi:uroporphyrinogen decarboxylase
MDGPVPLYELFSNIHIPVLQALGQTPASTKAGPDPAAQFDATLRDRIRYMELLGYDYVDVWDGHIGLRFPGPAWPTARQEDGGKGRGFVTSEMASIVDEAGFNQYPWPDPDKLFFDRLSCVHEMLPPGMKIIFSTRGILETTMDLLGHEKICYMLYDNPDFVRKVFDAVGERFLRVYERVIHHPAIGAVTYCDDMGFKTQPLLAPDTYREYLFPWHKKINDVAHRAGKPTILHACGNLDLIMEDIIACGWNAKHSFEDCIEPVWDAKKKYGSRIALMGGFDVDKLSRMTEAEVREHTRMMIEHCAPGGGWALGTGNSVPDYVPVQNFLAMIDESRRV